MFADLWAILVAFHTPALELWRHRPHLSIQSLPRWRRPRCDRAGTHQMLRFCSSFALMGRGAEKAPLETDGLDRNSARPTLAVVSQPVGGLGTGAEDTGAQLPGPSVSPLLPWGRPGKADSSVPVLWSPPFLPGLRGDPAGRPPWFSCPWLAPPCSSQACHQLRGVIRGHCPESSKGKIVLWKILG